MAISAADIQALMIRTGASAGPCHRALIAAEGAADRAAALLVDWQSLPVVLPERTSFQVELKFGAAEIPANVLKEGTTIRIKLFDACRVAVPCPPPLADGKWEATNDNDGVPHDPC